MSKVSDASIVVQAKLVKQFLSKTGKVVTVGEILLPYSVSKTSITHSLYIDSRNFMAMQENPKLCGEIYVNNHERKRENFGEV